MYKIEKGQFAAIVGPSGTQIAIPESQSGANNDKDLGKLQSFHCLSGAY
jgi:hypothetical protein